MQEDVAGSSLGLNMNFKSAQVYTPSAPVPDVHTAGMVLDLPPPDSDEWEDTPYNNPQQSPEKIGKRMGGR